MTQASAKRPITSVTVLGALMASSLRKRSAPVNWTKGALSARLRLAPPIVESRLLSVHLLDASGLYLYFWPATDASYINPPFATVNTAIPL